MGAGGNEARFVSGFGIGGVLGFNGGHQVVPHLVHEHGVVGGAVGVVVIVGGAHHDEGLANTHINHVVDSVLHQLVADEAVLGFIGAVEEVDDVVLLGGVVAIRHVHVGPLVQGVAVHRGSIFQLFNGAGVVAGRFPELGGIVAEVGFVSAVQFGDGFLPVFGGFPAFRQGGDHGAQGQHQGQNQANELFHHGFLLLLGRFCNAIIQRR